MGRTTTKAVGMALVMAAAVYGGCGDSVVVDTDLLPGTLTLSLDQLVLEVGDTITLSATVLDPQGDPITGISVTWSSSNPAVASVAANPDGSGFVTAVSGGATSITALASKEGKQVTVIIPVVVTAPEVPTTIELSPTFLALDVGESASVSATVLDQFGEPLPDETVSWSSADETVATVSSSGLVTGAGQGSTTITASAQDANEDLPVVVNPPLGESEPSYNPATDALIDNESFDAFSSYASEGGNELRDKYPTGRVTWPSGDFTFPHPDAETDGIVTLVSPGRGGSGKALRLKYGGADGGSDILVGTEGRLGSIGGLDGTLPEVAGPYTHIIFQSWFRTSVGADPSNFNDSSVKGFMLWNVNSDRWEIRPTLLRYRFTRWPDPRWGFDGGYPENDFTGHDHWKTADGFPELWSPYNDGNWHRFTWELYHDGDPSGRIGTRVWLDGVLIFDNVDDVLTGNNPDGIPWSDDIRTYDLGHVSHWYVWGNYVDAEVALLSAQFTIDFDDWLAWTDQP